MFARIEGMYKRGVFFKKKKKKRRVVQSQAHASRSFLSLPIEEPDKSIIVLRILVDIMGSRTGHIQFSICQTNAEVDSMGSKCQLMTRTLAC